MTPPDTIAPEQTGFELERFQWAGADRLEVEGRWFGVRGRRFVRPVLTVQVAGRRRRLLALLEHKPWPPDADAPWIAAFPWEGAKDEVGEAELEVGALTVDLPPPGGSRRRRRKPVTEAPAPRGRAPKPPTAAVAAEPDEPVIRRTAAETRQQLERDLAGARAELGRLRQRHTEEARELRSAAHEATARLDELTAQAAAASERAEQAAGEAARLREELNREREGRGAELERLREAQTEARAEADDHREQATAAAAELERLRSAAAETEALREERRRAAAEVEQLREAAREATAENQRLRQAARKSAAEAERLRAASRRPGAPRHPEPPRPAAPPSTAPDAATGAPPTGTTPDPPATGHRDPTGSAPDPPATGHRDPTTSEPDPPATSHRDPTTSAPDPQATVPFQVLPGAEPRVPAGPPPTVRRIPREQPRPAEGGDEAVAQPEPASRRAATERLPAEVTRLRGQAAPVQPPSTRPEPGGGAARLLGDQPRTLEGRAALAVWGPRLVAIILIVLLAVALGLIVRGLL